MWCSINRVLHLILETAQFIGRFFPDDLSVTNDMVDGRSQTMANLGQAHPIPSVGVG